MGSQALRLREGEPPERWPCDDSLLKTSREAIQARALLLRREHDRHERNRVTPFHLTVLSFIVVGVLHHSLKGVFALIEKAHEHLRESERLRGGAELVKGTGA